jgi:hypothetical protein
MDLNIFSVPHNIFLIGQKIQTKPGGWPKKHIIVQLNSLPFDNQGKEQANRAKGILYRKPGAFSLHPHFPILSCTYHVPPLTNHGH